jgi:hypothetical protein
MNSAMTSVLERVAARFGPDKVRRPVLVDDHRMERQTHWHPAPFSMPTGECASAVDILTFCVSAAGRRLASGALFCRDL